MKINREDIQKIKKIFKSPAMVQVFRWSKCVHHRIIWICILQVTMVFCSLTMTIVTKSLIDAAVSAQADGLWYFGLALLLLMLAEIAIGYISSLIRVHASAKLQHSLQGGRPVPQIRAVRNTDT